ncbi:hypothetical protein EXE30_02120 [Acinetobacter halotolerans]|uniref:YheC/YheD family protein n=1 Tax=Acinetobacter halotolerans TaxID=1752076 RepID=A0A4Q6XIT4_9GAMM|nr:YheC/YheD family protein [Acinetobacter halotolerans]RZF55625.1 hypothetical protein EXE30_02120 [Acinetobacter halotolerans]
MLIGILKPSFSVMEIEKIFMVVAHCHGHQSYVFTAKNVDFSSRTILGKSLIHGEVTVKRFPFPDLIQNRLSINEEDVLTYVKLAKEIYFTTHHIETKFELYKKMREHDLVKKYVVESERCDNFDILIYYILKYNYIVLKPMSSKQAIGVYTIQVFENKFIVKAFDQETLFNKGELNIFFNMKIKNKRFFISPFIASKTNNNLTSVFRLHMVVGKGGEWKKIKFFPYVNLRDEQDVANGIQGALISTREELFLQQYYPDSYQRILFGVDQLFRDMVCFMHNLYDWPVEAIGIDIGITQEGEMRIFEVNAAPGIGFMAYPVAEQQILYYEWILEQGCKLPVSNFLPRRYKNYYNISLE